MTIPIPSEGGPRFHGTETTLNPENPELNFPKWRTTIGRILPFVDPVVDKKTHQIPLKSSRDPEAHFNFWVIEVVKTRKSGRQTTKTIVPDYLRGKTVVGTQEWNMDAFPPGVETDEERQAWWEGEKRAGRVEIPEPPRFTPESESENES